MIKKNILFRPCELSSGIYILLSIYSLLVSAYLFIPLFVYGVIKNKKGAPIFIGLFFGVIGYSFSPPQEFDLYRHYESYEYFLQHGEFLYKTKDFYLEFLFYVGSWLSLNKEFIYFTSVVIYYTSIITVIMKLKERAQLKGLSFFLIFILFLFTNTIIEITGIRFTTALGFVSLFIYYYYIEQRKLLSSVFLILAICSHFSLVILPAAMLTLRITRTFFNSRQLSLCALIISVISGFCLVEPIVTFILLGIEQVFNVNIGAATYTSGLWGADRVSLHGFSQSGIVFENIKLGVSVAIPFILSYTFIQNRDYTKDELSRLFVVCSIIFFIFIPFDTVYMRYQFLLIVIALITYAKRDYKIKNLDGQFIGISMIYLKLLMQVTVGLLSTYVFFFQNIKLSLINTNLVAVLFDFF